MFQNRPVDTVRQELEVADTELTVKTGESECCPEHARQQRLIVETHTDDDVPALRARTIDKLCSNRTNRRPYTWHSCDQVTSYLSMLSKKHQPGGIHTERLASLNQSVIQAAMPITSSLLECGSNHQTSEPKFVHPCAGARKSLF